MINVAVIGFGFMGITHAVNILRNDKLKLRAIITRNVHGVPEKINSQIGNFSSGETDPTEILKVPVYKTLHDCLKEEKIAAVHICVHTDLHYEIARDALERGLHVLLEKPFCLRREEGTLLVALAKHQNVKLMVGHVLRFMPAYRKLKQWIDNRQFGALKFISLTRFSGLPSWGQWKQKQEQFGSSGGALFDLVIHDIDFLHYALGAPLKIESYCFPGALSANDYVSAQWHYEGIRAKIEGGNTFHSSFPFQAGYMAQFENASVVYSSRMPSFIQVCDDEKIHEIAAGDANDGFYDEIDYFATCIKNDTEPVECTPTSSLKTIELCYSHL
ncbi:MAG TPA: Gfo/Idh/MocA family oxidoreductase [Chryseolinea sp.]